MARDSRARRFDAACGFTLTELVVLLAIFGVMAAMAAPRLLSSIEGQRLNLETRNVERELQTARLSSVMTNQPIRVRFNCPAAGSYRRVELIGSVNLPSADDADSQAITRCNYPYPSDTDHNPLTRPNNDGAIRQLDSSVRFTAQQTVEFWPNGTVHVSGATNPWPLAGSAGVTITLAKGTTTKSITVNSLGKIQIQ